MRKIVLIPALICQLSSPLWSKPGVVFLTNGNTVEGEIEWLDPHTATVMMDFGSIEFASSEIRRVSYLPKKPSRNLSRIMTKQAMSLTSDPASYDRLIWEAADRYSVDAALVKAVMRQESNFNPWDVSHKGAMGLMQLMPETADELNVRNAFDPKENIDGGARYLSQMLGEFDGDLELALAAYNAGPRVVRRYNGIPPYPETQEYVRFVLKYYADYTKEGSSSLARSLD